AATTGPAGVTALTALGSDVERDPAGALASTIAAPVGLYAGQLASPMAAGAASRFASPAARKAAQLAGEVPASAAANVGQYAATSAALGRPITAEDLIEQGVTGGTLSGVMAPKVGRGRVTAPATDLATALRSPGARELAAQDYASRVEPGILARQFA